MDLQTFQAALHEGVEKERGLRWAEAADLYAELAKASSDPAMRALALLRRGNALMELRRWDDARSAFDAGLHDAKESGDPGIVAQALLAAGVFAANRDDPKRAEAFLLDALDRFHRKDDRAHLQGRGWAFLNRTSLSLLNPRSPTRVMAALQPTIQMSRTFLDGDSHGPRRDRIATTLEIVRRPAGPPRSLARRVSRRDPRPHRAERRRQDDHAQDPRRSAAAGLRDRAGEGPRRPRGSRRVQGGTGLHAGGSDAARVSDADRVPRIRRPHPESVERPDRGSDVRTPEGPRLGAEGRRDDRVPLERHEGEGRVRGRDHPRALDPRPRRAAPRDRSGGTASPEGAPPGHGPGRLHRARLDTPARHRGAVVRARRNRAPRAERCDGS